MRAQPKLRGALLRIALLACLLSLHAPLLRAQGCSQCRDNVSQTAPGVQKSYRVAIAVMLAGTLGVVGAMTLVLRRLQ